MMPGSKLNFSVLIGFCPSGFCATSDFSKGRKKLRAGLAIIVERVSGRAEMTHLQINLLGSFFMAQTAAKILIDNKETGGIVFIGSWAAQAPHPHLIAYSVSKAGLRMAMQCMALEWAASGIMVNEIAPGFVDAGLSAQEFLKNPGLRDRCEKQVPTQTLLTAEAIAQKVAFLFHPDAMGITGQSLTVDGGLSLVTPGRN